MAGSKFKKLISKCDFQKLNKRILSQVRYFDCIIIFQSTKMLAQIAYLRLCAPMSGFDSCRSSSTRIDVVNHYTNF